jgi:tetratricopeptide (TPR) repeat protein
MGKILQFSVNPPSKLGFERVKKGKKSGPSRQAQLNLFSPAGQILKLSPTTGPFEEALLLDERGDRRAYECYRNAISEGDSVADAYCNLGILESQSGRTAKAFDCFTKSLEHDPRHPESHYNLGNLYFEAADLRLARIHYELAAELDPTFPNIYFNLGLVHAMSEDYPAAIAALTTYRDLAPENESSKADELLASLQRSVNTRR